MRLISSNFDTFSWQKDTSMTFFPKPVFPVSLWGKHQINANQGTVYKMPD